MHRILIVLCGALFVCVSALAQSPMSGFPAGTFQSRAPLDAAISGGSVSWTGTAGVCQNVAFASATVTFNAVASGTGLGVVSAGDDSDKTHSAVTIDGNAATSAAATPGASMWYANSAHASITITVTSSSGNFGVVCISHGFLTGAAATPTCAGSCPVLATAFAAEPISLGANITVNTNGIGLVAAENYAAVSHTPMTWTNATNSAPTQAESTAGNGQLTGMATLTTTATPAFSCTISCAFSGSKMVGAAWAP